MLILVLASKCFQSEVSNPETGPHEQDSWAACAPQTLTHRNPKNPIDVSTAKLSEPPSSETELAELRPKFSVITFISPSFLRTLVKMA